jgi:dTDP-4-dehydrorhamnose reductase
VRDRDAVLALEPHRPDVIVHCAADVNMERCESDPAACWRVQVDGTLHVIELARRTGARFFYPQSAFVYDGAELPITESTPVNPVSVYGKYKLEAEIRLREQIPGALVPRMAGFFGGDDADKNFVGKFIRQIAGLLRQGQDHVEVGDRIWQPTYTIDLARNNLALLAAGKTGVYIMACHGEVSFFDLAKACLEELGLADRLRLKLVPAEKFSGRERAVRPMRMVMHNRRLQAEGLDMQRHWRVALKEYLARPYFQRLRQEALLGVS